MYYEKNQSKTKKYIKTFLYKIFGEKIYFIRTFYRFVITNLNTLKFQFYRIKYFNRKKDHNIKTNLHLIDMLGYDLNKIKNITTKYNIDFYGGKTSWHHHVLANFSTDLKLKILEIGTYKGHTSFYLSNIFPNSKIFTVDLPDIEFTPSDKKNSFKVPHGLQLISDYMPNNNPNIKSEAKNFIDIRSKNLQNKNIEFIQANSIDILNLFTKKSFDLIWVDGDHTAPQVVFDIFQAYHLCKIDGYLLCDDIIKNNFHDVTNSSSGYTALESLNSKKYLKTTYFYKTIGIDSVYRKIPHYFSISKRIV